MFYRVENEARHLRSSFCCRNIEMRFLPMIYREIEDGGSMLSTYKDRRLYTGLFSFVLFALVFVPSAKPAYKNYHIPTTTISVALSSPVGVSNLETGATHTENDVDPYANSRAMVSARRLLQSSLFYQNQAIMGWGADDPEPAPGVYNWSSLDARVQLMRETHARMVLTLCCAPGWMRPPGYQDDWSNLEVAPAPDHVQDFANLAQAVALRYPDVAYFQVWNEFKGMWSTSPGATPGIEDSNRWDYERYTTLYNAVYTAIKQVRPRDLVGGPYITMASVGNRVGAALAGPSYVWGTFDERSLDAIKYWLMHKDGADFITVDGSSANGDGVWLTNPFVAVQKFIAVTRWIRTQPDGGATLPIWWAEWYTGHPSIAGSLNYYNALMAAAEIATVQSGAAAALIWSPQGNARGFSYPEGIWTNPFRAGGGQATPYYATSYAFMHYFGPGTWLYKTTTSTINVSVIASATKTLVVNRLSWVQEIIVNGIAYYLNPYQVIVIRTP